MSKGPRFERRDDGVWVWAKPVRNETRAGLPVEKQPLEWDRYSLQRCIERFEYLERLREKSTNGSMYEHSLKLIAEEYWARVCNAVLLGDE